jgi:N-acetylglucosamine kinase-like BadF-type ATPase
LTTATVSNTIEAGKGELYFCVDGGGTRSRGWLLDPQGRSLAEAAGGPCKPSTNFELAVASTVDLRHQCCTAIGRSYDRVENVFAIGSAGTYLGAGEAFLAGGRIHASAR